MTNPADEQLSRTSSAVAPADTDRRSVQNHERPVDVWRYLASLARYWVPALVAGLLVGGLLGVRELKSHTSYTGTSYVSLVPAPTGTEAQATQQAAAASMLMRSYTSLAASPRVIEQAAESLGNYTQEQLTPLVTMGSPNGSLLISYTSTNTSEAEAARVVNAMAAAFVQQMPQMANASQPTLKLVAANVLKAQTPLPKTTSSKVTGLGISVVGGLIAAFLVAALAELLAGRRRRTA